MALDHLVVTRPLSPAERAALPDAWRALTTSPLPIFEFRDPPAPEQPRRRASDRMNWREWRAGW